MKAGPYIQRRYRLALELAESARAAARVKVEEAENLKREADRFAAEALEWARGTDLERGKVR